MLENWWSAYLTLLEMVTQAVDGICFIDMLLVVQNKMGIANPGS